MGTELIVRGSRLDAAGWDRLISSWAEKKHVDLYDEADLRDQGDGTSLAHLLAKGSVRGVQFRLERATRTMAVRLESFASRADWGMAYSVLRAALRNGGGTLEDGAGGVIDEKDLKVETANQRAMADFCADAQAAEETLEADGASIPISFRTFDIQITLGDIRGCGARTQVRIEEALAERVRRFAGAHPAPTERTADGRSVAAWGLGATIVGPVDEVLCDVGEEARVPLAALREVLGARAESAGQGRTLLPELDRERDNALIARVVAAAAEAATTAPNETSDVSGVALAGISGSESDSDLDALSDDDLTPFLARESGEESGDVPSAKAPPAPPRPPVTKPGASPAKPPPPLTRKSAPLGRKVVDLSSEDDLGGIAFSERAGSPASSLGNDTDDALESDSGDDLPALGEDSGGDGEDAPTPAPARPAPLAGKKPPFPKKPVPGNKPLLGKPPPQAKKPLPAKKVPLAKKPGVR